MPFFCAYMKISDFIPPIFSRKASQVVSIVVQASRSVALWSPKKHQQFSKDGYQASVTVYACVNEIARAAAGIPWILKRKGRSQDSRDSLLDEHKLLTLLRRPNPFQGGFSFIEAFTSYLLISGNSYIERVGPEKGPPLELYTHRPDRFTVLPDRNNMVAGYRFKISENQKDFLNGEIFHKKLFAPLDDWYGLSPIQVGAMDIDSDIEAKRWNLSLLKNDMKPPGAFIAEGELGDIQYARAKDQLQNKAGSHHAGTAILLENGMDWKNFSISQKDSDWINGRKMSKREICQLFQVPPELVGDSENKTYSNFKEARKSFYSETILPYMDGLRADLNNWLTPLFGEGIALDYDRDSINAIQVDRGALFERITKADWLTINEKRVETGFEKIDDGDVLLIRVGMVALDAVVDPTGGEEE